MLSSILIAMVMFVITTAIHASGMVYVVKVARRGNVPVVERFHQNRVVRVSMMIIFMFFVSLAEVLAWSIPYLLFGAIDGIEDAVYFSMVTYTTVGYGDIVLGGQWRLLASFEAANGIIMFGWTTAIIMNTIRQVYFRDNT